MVNNNKLIFGFYAILTPQVARKVIVTSPFRLGLATGHSLAGPGLYALLY